MAKKTRRTKGMLIPYLKPAATVGGLAGIGIGGAALGGSLARLIPTVDEWADRSAWYGAGIDFAAGAAVDLGAAFAIGKFTKAKPAQTLPFLLGGSLVYALAPIVAPYLASGVDSVTVKAAAMLPASLGASSPSMQARTYGGEGDAPNLHDAELARQRRAVNSL